VIGPDKKIADNAGFAVDKFRPYRDVNVVGYSDVWLANVGLRKIRKPLFDWPV
jgi:hypothetical protein